MFVKNINIEEISTKTLYDLWDKIYLTKSPKFISYKELSDNVIRMIGDFLCASRYYISFDSELSNYISKEDLEQILKGNETLYKTVIENLYSSLSEDIRSQLQKNNKNNFNNINSIDIEYENPRFHNYYNPVTFQKTNKCKINQKLSESDKITINRIKTIDSLFAQSSWDKCILTNIIFRNFNNVPDTSSKLETSIFPITKTFLSKVSQAISKINNQKIENFKISGIYAHDITIQKNRQQYSEQNLSFISSYSDQNENTNISEPINHNTWNVNISKKPEHLKNNEINYLLKYGIFDLEKSVKHLNKITLSKKKGYIYKISKSNMSNQQIFANISQHNFQKDITEHLDLVEKNIGSLPNTAIEILEKENPIDNLDI